MSITSIIRDHSEVLHPLRAQDLKSLVVDLDGNFWSHADWKAEIAIPPLSPAHAGWVGTAFDYLARVSTERRFFSPHTGKATAARSGGREVPPVAPNSPSSTESAGGCGARVGGRG